MFLNLVPQSSIMDLPCRQLTTRVKNRLRDLMTNLLLWLRRIGR
jgi:hypothetical protein